MQVATLLLKKTKKVPKIMSETVQKRKKVTFFGTFLKKCAKILASYGINAYICTQKRDSLCEMRLKSVRE
jgi:hypothetical protein